MSDISPIKIDIKADLTKPANKIVDTIVAPVKGIHKGITKIISACSGKWFANRDRQVALIAAQTAKDVEDIKSGKKEYRNGELLNVELAPTMADYYRQISEHNGACDAKRLEAAMFTAAIELYNTPEEEVSDEPLNQTFFNHWRAEAELIDDEDLRQWWAHLLVEETKKPNSISPRTLDVAKKLSQSEAKLFEKLSIGVMFGTALMISNENSEPIDGKHGDILTLQDAGIISSQRSSCQSKTQSKGEECITFSRVKIVFKVQSSQKIEINCYSLTRAGRELFNILDDKIVSDEEINKIKLMVQEYCSSSSISFEAITHLHNESYDINNLDLCTENIWL